MPRATPELTPEGTLTGGATVKSEYTGRPVPLDAQALAVLQEKIHIGTPVLDVEDRSLRTVEAYDNQSGYMRIEKEGLTVKDDFLPVTTVSFLDDKGIHLSEAKDTILNRFSRLPEVAREFFAR